MPTSQYLRPKEVAQMLNLSLSQIYTLSNKGLLTHVKLGKTRLFDRLTLQEDINKLTVKSKDVEKPLHDTTNHNSKPLKMASTAEVLDIVNKL